MIILPYNAESSARRFPVVTLTVCLLCILVFGAQISSQQAIRSDIERFCQQQDDYALSVVLEKVGSDCSTLFYQRHTSRMPNTDIEQWSQSAEDFHSLNTDTGKALIRERLESAQQQLVQRFEQPLITRLWYDPQGSHWWTMMSATVAHGHLPHLLINLLFFFAMASALEMVWGSRMTLLSVVALAFATHLSYRLLDSSGHSMPTVGLSGVLMGIIGLLACIHPKARIHCLCWYLVGTRILRIPVWLLAAWYIGWDIAQLQLNSQSDTNLIAHLSGAVWGLAGGLIVYRLLGVMPRPSQWQQQLSRY